MLEIEKKKKKKRGRIKKLFSSRSADYFTTQTNLSCTGFFNKSIAEEGEERREDEEEEEAEGRWKRK